MSDVGSEFDVAKDTRPLDAEEIDRLRLVLSNLEALEQILHTLTRDQTSLTEAVAVFATRTEQRQSQNMEQIKANQALLHEEEKWMHYDKAFKCKTTSQNVDQSANNHGYRNGEELYVEWDVVGSSPPNAPSFTNLELESRVSMGLKQKETPVYGGTEDDDIDVYVLKTISWYAAYGLYLRTAKKWLLQDYKGERRWSHIVRKKMKQRFVTRPREEDLVVSFFDCNQGSNFMDTYIDEFQRRSRSNDVSEKYKMIKFKKGLRSNQLRELVKTQIHESLDELFDAARSFNPRDVPAEKPTGSQNPYPGSNKKAGALKNKSNLAKIKSDLN
ncbi:hypothetical protein GN958_ATG20711 [Phytophthora infestans]|uniref:Retrotransposon gag domain-containing protein n=1 Tax=Phytophthora infestans TaxID=4787 RepID=A0A8S9TU92_PHYIN|nr:hypothetical protein GN958_ATG20711 [Phytophthora infestans]